MSLMDCLPPFLFALVVFVTGGAIAYMRERSQSGQREPITQSLPLISLVEDRRMDIERQAEAVSAHAWEESEGKR